MEIKTYHTETIVIEKPSAKLQGLIQRLKEHKQQTRERMRNITPMYILKA